MRRLSDTIISAENCKGGEGLLVGDGLCGLEMLSSPEDTELLLNLSKADVTIGALVSENLVALQKMTFDVFVDEMQSAAEATHDVVMTIFNLHQSLDSSHKPIHSFVRTKADVTRDNLSFRHVAAAFVALADGKLGLPQAAVDNSLLAWADVLGRVLQQSLRKLQEMDQFLMPDELGDYVGTAMAPCSAGTWSDKLKPLESFCSEWAASRDSLCRRNAGGHCYMVKLAGVKNVEQNIKLMKDVVRLHPAETQGFSRITQLGLAYNKAIAKEAVGSGAQLQEGVAASSRAIDFLTRAAVPDPRQPSEGR